MKYVCVSSLGWLISIFLLSSSSFASTACDSDDTYTQYFYESSDAKILLEQNCQAANISQEAASSGEGDCLCYDKNVSEILSQLMSGKGPVAVLTHRIMNIAHGQNCHEALQRCEQACAQAAETVLKNCGTVQMSGVSFY